MARDLWRQLLDAANAGKNVFVELSPGAEMKRPKRRRGRPTVRGATRYTRYGHYEGWKPTTIRPRCALRGCDRCLRRNQKIACCVDHHLKALAEARALIARAGET
jgi:hypothetical protein